MREVWLLAAALAWCGPAFAQSSVAPPAAATSPSVQAPAPSLAKAGDAVAPVADSASRTLTAGTVVEIELTDAVSSETAKRGDKFGLRLAQPIVLGDRVVVPTGAPGMGEVVFAQPAHLMGAAGKLVLAARYVDFGGQRLALHAFKLGAGGENRETETFVADLLFGPVSILIPGGGVEFPVGTRANAKLAADVVLTDPQPPTAAPAPTAAPPPAPTQTSTLPQRTK
jgi:hypothetical protein